MNEKQHFSGAYNHRGGYLALLAVAYLILSVVSVMVMIGRWHFGTVLPFSAAMGIVGLAVVARYAYKHHGVEPPADARGKVRSRHIVSIVQMIPLLLVALGVPFLLAYS